MAMFSLWEGEGGWVLLVDAIVFGIGLLLILGALDALVESYVRSRERNRKDDL